MALRPEPGAEGGLTPEPSSSTLYGRRDLLSRAGRWALCAALAGGAWISLRNLWPRGARARSLYLDAGRPEDYLIGQVSSRLLQEHQVWVVRTSAGFLAYSAVCTHLGCKLRHVPGEKQYRCMCHGSHFSAEGEVLRGPASRPMERVFITLSAEGGLQVDPGVRYRKERGEWSMPGAFLPYSGGKR